MQPWKAELALIFLRLRTREPLRAGSTEVTLVVCLARTLPQELIVSHCQPSIFISCPTNSLPSSQLLSMHTQNICFQILKQKSATEKDIQNQLLKRTSRTWMAWKEKGFLMCTYVCMQDTLSQLCKQTGAINRKFPRFPAAGGENWHWTKAKSAAITRHTGAEWRLDSGYWVKNVLCLFSSVCKACAVLSLHLNAESK